MSDVQRRIAAALEGRRSQRAFVTELADLWTQLSSGLADLDSGIAAASQALRSLERPSEEQRRVSDALSEFGSAEGRRRIAELARRAADAQADVEAVVQRVHRDTVNLGVVGMTKAGKSTLLRTITGLPDDVIPSTENDPTTATSSRIYHRSGPSSATLSLHTWESFRDGYLAPLHAAAGLGPAPSTRGQFAQTHYPHVPEDPDARADVQKFLTRLIAARSSFASYEPLLRGGELDVSLSRLRPFVAYPVEGVHDPDYRPYHAVRGVRIEQAFPNLDVSDVGLVDLPGRGEAGLDVERQFLQGIRNEVDLLLMVKRPTVASAFVTEEDWQTIRLADAARGGVGLDDFVFVVVNRDSAHLPQALFDNAIQRITTETAKRGIRVLAPDVADPGQVVTGLMEPALAHLAARLAEMDRAAVTRVLQTVEQVGRDVQALTQEVQQRVRGWRSQLPNEQDAFRRLAIDLRNTIALDLTALLARYDELVQDDRPIEDLERGITEAAQTMRAYVDAGLGRGSREAWTTATERAYAAGALDAKQDEYYRLRSEASRVFGRIDLSLSQSVERLWVEVADLLRERLTEGLVPPSAGGTAADEPLRALRGTASDHDAPIIAAALTELLDLRINFGSIVLRVAQPIVRRIHWDADDILLVNVGESASATAPTPPAAGRRYQDDPPVTGRQPRRAAAAPPRRSRSRSDGPDGPTGPASDRDLDFGGTERQQAQRGTRRLYEELTTILHRRIDELEQALLHEARTTASILAAAADRFFVQVSQTNEVEWHYERLTRPVQRQIWPAMFDGGGAALIAELTRVDEQALTTGTAAARIVALAGARRLHTDAGA
ncbi:GTPase [Frankia sp. QA3]|uniref:GTPase n=1 Tax=Frankia sp. QA3 TaxID=710111 RepID=UPI000269BBA6|nr:GTPase [Frankia sp. QA3]EIV91715.1 hypothetical protein FraQA3DRAFT_1180 [Frankia sp. QA3]